jgi:hypothetical protein
MKIVQQITELLEQMPSSRTALLALAAMMLLSSFGFSTIGMLTRTLGLADVERERKLVQLRRRVRMRRIKRYVAPFAVASIVFAAAAMLL